MYQFNNNAAKVLPRVSMLLKLLYKRIKAWITKSCLKDTRHYSRENRSENGDAQIISCNFFKIHDIILLGQINRTNEQF